MPIEMKTADLGAAVADGVGRAGEELVDGARLSEDAELGCASPRTEAVLDAIESAVKLGVLLLVALTGNGECLRAIFLTLPCLIDEVVGVVGCAVVPTVRASEVAGVCEATWLGQR